MAKIDKKSKTNKKNGTKKSPLNKTTRKIRKYKKRGGDIFKKEKKGRKTIFNFNALNKNFNCTRNLGSDAKAALERILYYFRNNVVNMTEIKITEKTRLRINKDRQENNYIEKERKQILKDYPQLRNNTSNRVGTGTNFLTNLAAFANIGGSNDIPPLLVSEKNTSVEFADIISAYNKALDHLISDDGYYDCITDYLTKHFKKEPRKDITSIKLVIDYRQKEKKNLDINSIYKINNKFNTLIEKVKNPHKSNEEISDAVTTQKENEQEAAYIQELNKVIKSHQKHADAIENSLVNHNFEKINNMYTKACNFSVTKDDIRKYKTVFNEYDSNWNNNNWEIYYKRELNIKNGKGEIIHPLEPLLYKRILESHELTYLIEGYIFQTLKKYGGEFIFQRDKAAWGDSCNT